MIELQNRDHSWKGNAIFLLTDFNLIAVVFNTDKSKFQEDIRLCLIKKRYHPISIPKLEKSILKTPQHWTKEVVYGVKHSMPKHLQNPQKPNKWMCIYSASSWEVVTEEHLKACRPANLAFAKVNNKRARWKIRTNTWGCRLTSTHMTIHFYTWIHTWEHMYTYTQKNPNFHKRISIPIVCTEGKGSALIIWMFAWEKGWIIWPFGKQ